MKNSYFIIFANETLCETVDFTKLFVLICKVIYLYETHALHVEAVSSKSIFRQIDPNKIRCYSIKITTNEKKL